MGKLFGTWYKIKEAIKTVDYHYQEKKKHNKQFSGRGKQRRLFLS